MKKYQDAYLVKRNGYNKIPFSYYDLVTEEELKNSKGQRVIKISHNSLSTSESRKLLPRASKFSVPFNQMDGVYTLVEIEKNKISFQYTYLQKTDHWLISRDMMLDSLYDGTISGVSLTMDSVALVIL